MNFVEELKGSTDTKYGAYLAFISGRGREGFSFYAFVEDDDDIEFYQHVLHDADVNFLGCGGKNNVIAIYDRVCSEGLLSECWFFVDRDHEVQPLQHENFILRTAGYSWENHCIEKDVVRNFLARKLQPMPGGTTIERLLDNWQSSFANFSHILALQLTIIRLCHCKNLEAGIADLIVTQNHTNIGIELFPCQSISDRIAQRLTEVVDSPGELGLITEVADRITDAGVEMMCRGKTAFLIFREFLNKLRSEEQRSFRVQTNSSLTIIKNVSQGLANFEYIRSYAARRRAESL